MCAHARVHMYCTHYVSVVKSFPQIEFGTQWFLKTDQSKYVGMQWFQPLYKCDHFSQSGENYNLEWVGDPFLLRVFLHKISKFPNFLFFSEYFFTKFPNLYNMRPPLTQNGKCQKYVKSKYFLMLLPDDLIIKNNCSKEMIRLHKKTNGSIIATKRVERKTVSRWGILSIKNKKKGYFQIKDVVEKPSIKKAPSNFAIIGRYILPTKIFGEIKKLKPGQGGEIHITDAIRSLIKKENKFYGNIFKGKYLDCGTLSGYINSGIQISKGK